MSKGVAETIRRNGFRFALTGLAGIWLAGCADSTRFAESPSPFSNPFGATASNDSVAPTPRISSQPLSTAKPYNTSYATPARPSPTSFATAHAPAPDATGSIHPSAVGGSSAGWSAVGGSPVIVGEADDATTLSTRYGVPEAALLSANGLRSRSEIHANMRLVIPVYNARGSERVAKTDVARTDEEPHHARHDEDKSGSLDAQRHKLEAKRDESEDDSKSKHAEAAKKHKAEAKRDDDSNDAPKAEKHKKSAKADDGDKEKVASADKPEKHAKDKTEKHAEDAPRPEKKKPEVAAKPAPEVAKTEAPKLPSKADTDHTGTGGLGSAASATALASDDGKFRWPARGRIIGGFKTGGNEGINIALPEGTSVRAAEDGKVAYAGSALKQYGNLVLIRHSNGYVTAYANNGELSVKSGDTVKRGQVIAKSGATGDVSTPQLHFELRKGQTPVDPTSYLAGL